MMGYNMLSASLKKQLLPAAAMGAAFALSACASNGQPSTRYGGTFAEWHEACCQPVVCCQAPIPQPIIPVQHIVEVPAPPPPAPVIEYVHEEPAPPPVYTPPPVTVVEPTPPPPVYTPPPAPPLPSCPEGQIPSYGGTGCIPIVPLRKFVMRG